MGTLTDHARRELELIGQFEEDPQFAQSIVAAVAAFESYGGHSGGSAFAGITMLHDLLHFNNLSPLTNDPDEWLRHTPDNWDGEHHIWQNKRNGKAFSEDGGLTYRLNDDIGARERALYRSLITHDDNGEKIERG